MHFTIKCLSPMFVCFLSLVVMTVALPAPAGESNGASPLPAAGMEQPGDGEKTIVLKPDRTVVGLEHPGCVDDETFQTYNVRLGISNFPPAVMIKKMILSGKPRVTGSVKEIKIKVLINGVEQEKMTVNVPGFMVDLYRSLANSIDLKGVVKGEEITENLRAGGDFAFEAIIDVRGSAPFSIMINDMRAELVVQSGTAMPFPSNLECPPILDSSVSSRIKPSDTQFFNVYKGSTFKVSLLWDGSEVASSSFTMDDGFEANQRKLLELGWMSGEFVTMETTPGEHTLQARADFTEADSDGFMVGPTVVLAPQEPKKVLVLPQEAANSYYPIAFVNILGANRIDEDVSFSWAFSYQATFPKEAPNPLMVRSQGAADGYSGIVPASLQYCVVWGDGTPPTSPTGLSPDQKKVWQDAINLNHTYRQPGEYQMTVKLDYKVRRYKPVPNIEELTSWEPYDTAFESVNATKRIIVADKTPPVISDESYNFDVPRYPGNDESTESADSFQMEIMVFDNSPKPLSKATLHFQLGELWTNKEAREITRLTPEGVLPAKFRCWFSVDIPRNLATKPPIERRYPHYVEVADAAENVNDGDLDIRDNDRPPTYNADSRGALGYFVVYDTIAPAIKISYHDPSTKSLMEYAALSQKSDGSHWYMLIGCYETPYGSTEKKTLLEQNFADFNDYPVMRLDEVRHPVKFPSKITILEDQRLQVEIECSDLVDHRKVFVEFYVDDKLVHKSESGFFTGPIIFREPGTKKFSVVAYDQKNMDGSFNAIRMEIDVEVLDSKLSVKTLQRGD